MMRWLGGGFNCSKGGTKPCLLGDGFNSVWNLGFVQTNICRDWWKTDSGPHLEPPLSSMSLIPPSNCNSPLKLSCSTLQTLSNLATDVNTGHCRDLCYAVNAVYAQKELYGGSLRMQLEGEARVVEEEEERWKKLNGKNWMPGTIWEENEA